MLPDVHVAMPSARRDSGRHRRPDGGDAVNRVTDADYRRKPRPRRPTPAVAALARRLSVEPRTVRALARQLDVDLYWLDVASAPDVISGHPSTWDGCIVLGIHPVTGEALNGGVA
jgi:hypothetical protein